MATDKERAQVWRHDVNHSPLDPRVLEVRPDVYIVRGESLHEFKDWLCCTLKLFVLDLDRSRLIFHFKPRKEYGAFFIDVYNRATLPSRPEDMDELGINPLSCMAFVVAKHGLHDVEWICRCYEELYRESMYNFIFELAAERYNIHAVVRNGGAAIARGSQE
jgi:hypothetical protein